MVGGVTLDFTAGTAADVATGELYDLAHNVSESYQLGTARNSHRVVAMPDGTALVIGGFAGGQTTVSGLDGASVGNCELFRIP